ncbi:MAG: rhodanese-like domain-containing protein [Bacteroidota bacterium]
MIKQTLKEISILLGCALLLSFAHTLLSRQGFFKPAVPHPKEVPAKNLEMITLSDAKDLFYGGSALFVDARHEYDFKKGSIQGAINIPLSDFDTLRTSLDKIPKDKRIIVYCNGEQCNSSMELAAKLSEFGFTNVNIFFGGWQEWSLAGLPISK